MRLSNYLTEANNANQKMIKGIMSKLQRNYSEHLRFVKSVMLEHSDREFESFWSRCFFYRGARGPQIFERAVRKDRTPKDTVYKMQIWLDDAFEKKFGWRPRSQGLFATGNFDQAQGYQDNPYIIFPSNNYKFIWSEKIGDIYRDLQFVDYEDSDNFKVRETFRRRWEHLFAGVEEPEQSFDDYIEEYENSWKFKVQDAVEKYRNDDLRKAMVFGNEVMFGCNKYYAVLFEYFGKKLAWYIRYGEASFNMDLWKK
jgi:hypothetical protein